MTSAMLPLPISSACSAGLMPGSRTGAGAILSLGIGGGDLCGGEWRGAVHDVVVVEGGDLWFGEPEHGGEDVVGVLANRCCSPPDSAGCERHLGDDAVDADRDAGLV